MKEAQTLAEKVYLYLNFFPNNSLYLNFQYREELGQEYGYDAVFKEIKRQEKDCI